MRAVLCLEDVGWGGYAEKFNRIRPGRSPRAWVARLTSFNPDEGVFGDFERYFLHGQRDFSRVNSTGSRGIFLYYALTPGVYEVNDRVSWSSVRRYFCRVDEGSTAITEITREEAIACLANEDSASAS